MDQRNDGWMEREGGVDKVVVRFIRSGQLGSEVVMQRWWSVKQVKGKGNEGSDNQG